MFYVFNIVIIALALLIAYWWANQGLFSALMHFACVVVSGALAFATWEPLALLLLRRGWMDNYAWGVTLLLPFAVYLLVTRVLCDKIVGDNLNFPQWANMVFGGALGFASGILTVGMCMLGCGFLQSSHTIGGFDGVLRTSQARGQPDFDGQKLWVPMHRLTASTFGFLGVNALEPEAGRSLSHAYPLVADQSFSLHRDSAERGRAKTAAPPDSVQLGKFYFSPDCENVDRSTGAYVLEMDIDNTAADSGGQVTVTASQVRLIEDLPTSVTREAKASYPDQWTQPTESGARQLWAFDDILHVATNVPGQQKTKFYFFFPAAPLGSPDAGGRAPQFVQFKGMRLRLPALQPDRPSDPVVKGIARGVGGGGQLQAPVFDPNVKSVASKDITLNDTIAPAVVSINELTTMEQSDQYLTEGKQEFQRGGQSPSPANRIKGIYQRDGTKIVRLNISRRISSLDLWNDRSKVREEAGENATLYLVDSLGNQYAPIGYVWIKPDGVEIMLDPKRGIPTIGDFPSQPSSGTHELYALFSPTAGAMIMSIRLGNVMVANAEMQVPTSQ